MKSTTAFLILFLLPLALLQAAQSPFERADSLYRHKIVEDRALAWPHLREQARLQQSPQEKVRFLLNQSTWYLGDNNVDSALYFNRQAQTASPDDKYLGMVYVELSYLFLQQDRPDSARIYLKRATVLLPPSAEEERFRAFLRLASSYQRTGAFDSAFKYIRLTFKETESATPKQKPSQVAYCNQIMGMHYFRTSVYDSALTYLLRAADGFEATGNRAGSSQAMDAVGGVLNFQEKYADALPYYRKAVAIARETGAKGNEAEYLHNTGTVFKNMAKSDSAKAYFLKALDMAQVNGQVRLQANCSGNLGGILLEEGDPEGALQHLQNSERLFTEIRNPVGICLSRVGLGQCQQSLGNRKAALQYLQDARRIAAQLPILEIQKECATALFDYYQALPNVDSSLTYFMQLTEIKDSIRGTAVQKQVERLQIEYETRLKEEENERLNAELMFEQEKSHTAKVRFGWAISCILLVLLGVGAVSYFRSKAKKLRILLLQEELKNEERKRKSIMANLEAAQETIVQKNRLLTKVESDLKSGASLNQLADKLYERINTQGDWMQFMIEFELVHAGYFDRLKQHTPNLSPNDLRFAALLRLQLSNKEMAEVLMITQEGVKKAKNRLKKKLGLAANVKLTSFASNL